MNILFLHPMPPVQLYPESWISPLCTLCSACYQNFAMFEDAKLDAYGMCHYMDICRINPQVDVHHHFLFVGHIFFFNPLHFLLMRH